MTKTTFVSARKKSTSPKILRQKNRPSKGWAMSNWPFQLKNKPHSTNTLENMHQPLLKVENLKKSYSGKTVVDGLSFDVKPGEVVGLLGPNGACKTTAFYMAIGLIHPDDG